VYVEEEPHFKEMVKEEIPRNRWNARVDQAHHRHLMEYRSKTKLAEMLLPMKFK
jgi:hypothetical protein